MDFFYDGGTKVFTPEDKCIDNLDSIRRFIKKNDSIDFFFIQEIDKASKRSYNIDEYDSMSATLTTHKGFFATNYDVFFVPVPPASPMGKVLSGLAIFSKSDPSSSVRYSFPGEYGFPKQLFMLDRCFLVNRYPLSNGHQLIIINTHNEAFDKGNIRKAQMAYLKEFMLSEYKKDNYVIAGGDWNQTPPEFKPDLSIISLTRLIWSFPPISCLRVGNGFMTTQILQNAMLSLHTKPSVTPTTIFDFFLLSPNVKAISVKCINLNFENSDHNPVILRLD